MFISDGDDFSVSTTQLDGTLVIHLNYKGQRVSQIFDQSNGKHLLKIADAIMTAIQDQNLAEERKQAETEHFNKNCQLCLVPFTEGCVHASEYAGA